MKKHYKCEKCKDTGLVQVKNNTFRECECSIRERSKKQFKRTGLNLESSTQTLESFKVWNVNSKVAKQAAINYINNYSEIAHKRQNSIAFVGQVGSGKTHLSISLAQKLLEQGVRVVYMPYRDTITKIKQNMLDKEYYKMELNRYQNAEILLIDDLFKGKITESDINILFEIVNYRYLNYLPIIVSSEFGVSGLLNFDEAVGSRIYEMCKDYTVQIEKDLRNNYRLR